MDRGLHTLRPVADCCIMASIEACTLWSLCQHLNTDELRELHSLAMQRDVCELKGRLQKVFVGSPGKAAQLEEALLRFCSGATAIIDAPPSHSQIILELEQLVGLAERKASSWRLEVGRSSAPGGSEGVFIRGACAASSVLSAYPGVIYHIADLPLMATSILPDNHYMLFLHNGVVIDGRPHGPSSDVFEACCQRDSCIDAASDPPLIKDSVLALGHKVNHPPPGMAPNVRVVPFDLGRDEHAALHRFLPVVHASAPSESTPSKRTAVLVACRPLCDEELWLDYKLSETNHRLPEWYTPCEPTMRPSGSGAPCWSRPAPTAAPPFESEPTSASPASSPLVVSSPRAYYDY